MAKIVRTEVRQTGVIGKIFKWIFILFNLFMAFIALKTCALTGDVMDGAHSTAERAGSALGGGIAISMLLVFWVLGDAVTGALMLVTRGKKVIIEESVE